MKILIVNRSTVPNTEISKIELDLYDQAWFLRFYLQNIFRTLLQERLNFFRKYFQYFKSP